MKNTLTIATRESQLALWQANWVKTRLEALHPNLTINLLGLTTVADKMLDITLNKVGGKGLFVKELEEALLDKRADMAVHSMKDVPTELPKGLILPVMCKREDPHDAFVSNNFKQLSDLPEGATIGTSSLRRSTQIKAIRPDIKIKFLRGNVNTRLSKLDNGEYDAIILAAAGLKRLGFQDRIASLLKTSECLPSAGQGVLGVECRESDDETIELIKTLQHEPSQIRVTAERIVCQKLGGSCQVPIGAYAKIVDDKIWLRGLVADPDGTAILRAEGEAFIESYVELANQVADELIGKGALGFL